MTIVERLVAVFAPYNCLSCGNQGALLCSNCQPQLTRLSPRCYRCQVMSRGARTCPTCRTISQLTAVYSATDYQKLAKNLVWQFKFNSTPGAADELAQLITERWLLPNALLVPTPTASSRVRQRGYDQANLLAKALSRRTGLPYYACLSRNNQGNQAHQVGANRMQRQKQLQSAFRVHSHKSLTGKHLILVDDVLTTGATLESAATALKNAGAVRVDAVVFAQALPKV